ncbi:30S ribosomal protein S3 [Candidatus Vidania fulgoroideorum]
MGKKVNPKFFRINNLKNWNTIFFPEKKYSFYIINYIKLKKYLNQLLKDLIIDFYIEYLEKCYLITIISSKPGIIIGKKGINIKILKNKINNIIKKNIFINIKNITEISPKIIFNLIFFKIKNNLAYKKFIKKTIFNLIKLNIIKGIKIVLSGRLNGSDLSKKEKFLTGSIPLHTIKEHIKYYNNFLKTKYGIIGIKIWICYFK